MHTQSLLFDGQGMPAVSLAHVSPRLLLQREHAATARAQAHAARELAPGDLRTGADLLGRAMLWHGECPRGLFLLVCDTPLYRLTATLAQELPAMNDGQPLDGDDFGYVADVLRELLADCKSVQEELALGRALAWVVWEGEKLGE